MKRKKATKKKVKKALVTKPVIINSIQPSRMEAITNLSRAILETARALNTPAIVVRDYYFDATGKGPSLGVCTKTEK